MVKSMLNRHYWVRWGREFVYDLFNTPQLSWSQKWWAYRRGFLARRIIEYGLNDDNSHLYLPDWAYYRLHPINGRFSFWTDDKLTIKYILEPFDIYLPRYYYHIGLYEQVNRLMDCPDHYGQNPEGMLNIVHELGAMAAQPSSGSRGLGFYKSGYQGGQYSLNDRPASPADIADFLAAREDYVFTELLVSHPDLVRIGDGAASSVKIVAYRNEDQPIRLAGAYIKFGSSLSGTMDNMSAGCIVADINLANGEFGDSKIFRENRVYPIQVHPDSGAEIGGTVPFWEEIKSTLSKVGEYLTHFRYLGYDIIITPDGFKFVEIDSLPAIDVLNCYHPLLDDPSVAQFFDSMRRM